MKPLPPIWDTLRRIQILLRLDDQTLAGLMRITAREFAKLKEGRIDPGVRSTISLAEAINVSFDSLVTGEIDYIAMAHQHAGNELSMPEKYLVGANSRNRTILNHLNYIEKRWGWEERARLLRHFQLTEAMFSNPNELINLRLSVDIGDLIFKRNGDKEILLEMGLNSAKTHKNGPIGREAAGAKNLHELYEMMFGDIVHKYVESNFMWNIHAANATSCVVRGVPNWDLVPLLGEEYIRSGVGCLLRAGFISSVPYHLGYPSSRIQKRACVAHGDKECRFELDFEPLLRARRSGIQPMSADILRN